MSFSRAVLRTVTVLLVLGAVGAGIWWRVRSENENVTQAQASQADTIGIDIGLTATQFSTDVPQPVQGAVVVRDTLWVSVSAAGRAEAIRRAVVKSQVEGVIEVIRVRENSSVGQGQAILQIDSTELALTMAEARAEHQNAEAQFQSLILFADEIRDPEVRRRREQNARAQSGLASALVRLQRDSLTLARSTVRAPFGGRIADLLVVAGQHITAGTDLMTVVALNPIKVEAEVLEAELGHLQEGRNAAVTFAAFPGEVFEGRVQSINPVVNAQERTGRVTILIQNPEGRIKPGMYADVSIEARSFPDRILIPRAAVLERDRRNMLFVYEEQQGRGLAKWRYVVTGEENATMVEIVPSDEDMVAPGEIVLVDGHHYLAHDTPVQLVENVAAAGGRPGG